MQVDLVEEGGGMLHECGGVETTFPSLQNSHTPFDKFHVKII